MHQFGGFGPPAGGPPLGYQMMSPGGYRPPAGFAPVVQTPPRPSPQFVSSISSAPMIAKPPEQMTTVYVGKIPAGVEDSFIRKLLEVPNS